MDESLRRDLIKIIDNRRKEAVKGKEATLRKSEAIDRLQALVHSLEESLENLRNYSREKLEEELKSYFSPTLLKDMLDKLEIARLVLTMKDNGVVVEFNDEELNIVIDFLESVRSLKENEEKKHRKAIEEGVKKYDKRIKELDTMSSKLQNDNNSKEVMTKAEIDDLMQIAVEEEADERTQIEILCLLNQINVSIHRRNCN